MKTLDSTINNLIGLALGIAVVFGGGWYISQNPAVLAPMQGFLDGEQAVSAAPSPPVASTPSPPTTHLPATMPEAGLIIRGVKMPADCQDPNKTGMQNMVTYVSQHPEIPDSEVAGYVCGWN